MLKRRKKNNIVFLTIFFVVFSVYASGQKLQKRYSLEQFQIINCSCDFRATDYDMKMIFKSRRNRANKLFILDESNNGITDIRTILFVVKNDSISMYWPPEHWERGHNLYNRCLGDFKKAFALKYHMEFKDDKLILKNDQYIFILKQKDRKCKLKKR